MKIIRLAVIFDQRIEYGGGYQQALNAALLAQSLPKKLVNVFFFTTIKENIKVLENYGINSKFIYLSLFFKIKNYIRKQSAYLYFPKIIKRLVQYTKFEKKLLDHKIDLVYFLSPTFLTNSLENLNYITTVWDLCHRDHPEFPEMRANCGIELKDQEFTRSLTRATGIIVDSEFGKIKVSKIYSIDEEKIHVIPFQSSIVVQNCSNFNELPKKKISEKYNLNLPYIFYPAQFWAHKNHIYLLKGLNLLEQQYGLKFGAIFCGADKGNLSYVKNYANSLGLKDRIRFLGFVANEEIPDLYRQSVALVMPTYFGPTNIPPFEAFELGVPVLYSDEPILKDQVGNAALLIDLKNPLSMATNLKNLSQNLQLRENLIKAGYERIKYFNSIDRLKNLQKIIEDFSWKRICWE